MTNCRELASTHLELSLLGECPSCQRSVHFHWEVFRVNASGHREPVPDADSLTSGAGQCLPTYGPGADHLGYGAVGYGAVVERR